MDFLKKFGLYIVFGVIALVAIVAGLFYPLPGMLADLKGEVDTRAALRSDLDSLANKSRTMPDVSLTSEDPEPLTRFPTQTVYDAGLAAVSEFQQSADAVINLIDQYNTKTLLVPDSLPLELGDTNRIVLLQDFQRTYQRRMNANGTTFDASLVADPLEGTFPLDNEELNREATNIESVLQQRIQYDREGNAVNAEEVDAEITKQLDSLADRLVARKAQNAKLYVSPDAFEISASMTPRDTNNSTTVPTNIDVFYAQVSLWVQEEVADAIAYANRDAANILEAPVKHLLRVEVNANALGGLEGNGSRGSRRGAEATPADIDYPANAAATIEYDYTRSLSGRESNPFYEVVPFTVRMRVTATRVPEVLNAFGQNRLLTVLNVASMEMVDNGVAKSQSFLYGDDPVVELEVEGEALLLRTWLAQYVPEKVKASIMQVEPESPTGGSEGYGGDPYGGYGGDPYGGGPGYEGGF